MRLRTIAAAISLMAASALAIPTATAANFDFNIARPAGFVAPNPQKCYPIYSFEGQQLRGRGGYGIVVTGGVTLICERCLRVGNTYACTNDHPEPRWDK